MTTSVPQSLAGRTAVVTGATSGIGVEIARGLAARGARTVVVGRGEERAAATAQELVRSTGNPAVESIGVTDLALMSDIQVLAEKIRGRFPNVSILVNNAGAYLRRRELTAEGHERTFALNVLAPYLLTSLLAERLRAAAPSRVVNVASTAHHGYRVDFANLEGATGYSGYRAYGRSKLELILLTREFARRFAGSGVSVNAVHPGFVASGFGQNNGGGTRIGFRILEALFAISVQRGAETPLYVATDPSAAPISGEYFARRRVVPASNASTNMADARKVYQVCAEITGVDRLPETGPP